MNRELILQELLQDFVNIAGNSSGLCVLKKVIALCSSGELAKYQADIAGRITEHSLELAQNPYGNYAMQAALSAYPVDLFTPIFEGVRGKLVQLSITKYSSNVVERCLERAEPQCRTLLLQELLVPDNVLSASLCSYS
jgi:hypothetical protein